MRRGFTLLEVMIALLLMGVVMGMVLSVSRSSLALSKSIVDLQSAEMERQAFHDFLSRCFTTMPGNARMQLDVEEAASGQYLSDLTLQNVPMSFTWGGEERIAKAVRLSTVRQRSGLLDVVLRYYENEQIEGTGMSGSAGLTQDEPFAEIVLMSGLAFFEWRVLDSQSMQWAYEWNDAQRRPLQMELVMATGTGQEEMRQVFWLPPKQNPEAAIRQMGQSRRGADQQPGGHPEIHSGPIPNPGGQP